MNNLFSQSISRYFKPPYWLELTVYIDYWPLAVLLFIKYIWKKFMMKFWAVNRSFPISCSVSVSGERFRDLIRDRSIGTWKRPKSPRKIFDFRGQWKPSRRNRLWKYATRYGRQVPFRLSIPFGGGIYLSERGRRYRAETSAAPTLIRKINRGPDERHEREFIQDRTVYCNHP